MSKERLLGEEDNFGSDSVSEDGLPLSAFFSADISKWNILKMLCNILCCPPCLPQIVGKVAFEPPYPVSYKFEGDPGHQSLFVVDEYTNEWELFKFTKGCVHLFMLPTTRGHNIAAYYLERKDAKFTLLFSHGNATDIGQIAYYLPTLSDDLKCSIFAYDYAGYGQSTGKRTMEADLYVDIRAAWDCLRNQFGVASDHIILYGQSIGTVATVDLAAKLPMIERNGKSCAGVVLHSPLSSGFRVLRPSLSVNCCCDPFPSMKKIDRIKAPTLVIHGLKDEIVSISHGRALYAKLKQAGPYAMTPLFLEDAQHNDVERYPEYLMRLRAFLAEISDNTSTG